MSLLVNKATFLFVFTTFTNHQSILLSMYNKTNDGEDIGSELLNTLTKKDIHHTKQKYELPAASSCLLYVSVTYNLPNLNQLYFITS